MGKMMLFGRFFLYRVNLLSGTTYKVKNKRVLPQTDKTSVCFDLSVKKRMRVLAENKPRYRVVI